MEGNKNLLLQRRSHFGSIFIVIQSFKRPQESITGSGGATVRDQSQRLRASPHLPFKVCIFRLDAPGRVRAALPSTGFAEAGVASLDIPPTSTAPFPSITTQPGLGGGGSGFSFSSYQTVGFSITEKALRWEGHLSQTNFVLPPTLSCLGWRVMTRPPDIPLGTGMWVPLTVRPLGEPKALASRLSIWGRDSR